MVFQRDLTPLFRAAIGYDHMADILDNLIPEQGSGSGYPPYNIEKLGENRYRITMAVAGFSADDLDIQTEEDRLIVSGRLMNGEQSDNREFLHRGIAERAFERQFSLADNVKVLFANLEHGILSVELEREIPEHKKSRKIMISVPASTQDSDSKKLTSGKDRSAA